MMSRTKFEIEIDKLSNRVFSSRLAIWLVFFSIFACLYYSSQADNDLFARLAVGKLIQETGEIPLKDPFSYSETKETWYDHEWLAGLSFYYLDKAGGDFALLLASFSFFSLSLFFLHRTQKVSGVTVEQSLYLLFLSIFPNAYLWNSVIRSHVYTFLFTAILFYILKLYQKKKDLRALFVLPAIFLVWANVHGGFVSGLCFLTIFLISSFFTDRKNFFKLSLIYLLSILAPLINPYGTDYLFFILEAVSKPRYEIYEWQNLNLFSLKQIVLWIFILGICIDSLFIKTKSDFYAKIFLIASLIQGIMHQRFIAFFYFVAIAYFSPQLINSTKLVFNKLPVLLKKLSRSLFVFMLLTSALGFLLLIKTSLSNQSYKLNYEKYPVAAMDWLNTYGDGGKLLIHFNDGSYALWKGYPKYKVSIDGRYEEVYPDHVVQEVNQLFSEAAPTKLPFFYKYKPDYILLCRHSTWGYREISYGNDWRIVYDDQKCKIHEKRKRGTKGGRERG